MKYIYFYDTIIGKIGIAEENEKITNLIFENQPLFQAELQETKLIKIAYQQLEEYLNGNRRGFDLPLNLNGTLFMKQVWRELQNIPYGKTMTYKEIAEKIGNNKASRAVGMASNKNPLPIFIPCHRVIGSNKKLVGYTGGLELKKKLIDIENK